MANLKELIEALQVGYAFNPLVKSTGYGEIEAIDTSKTGVEYMRVYIHWLSADKYTVSLRIYVVDEVLSDLSNRLQVQSDTLTVAKELVQMMVSKPFIKEDADITFEPTRLNGGDQHEGVYFEVEITINEDITIC